MDNFLSPYIRNTYLENLRPPEGFVFDRGIATTFSLDLLALLIAPLSMALFEAGSKDEILKDPIGVLEALRRTSDRLAIFCQQGRIAIPKADSLLYSYLEPIVVEVQPPNKQGVFHPKIWAIRFINLKEKEIHYRFICLSRNLTFDHSWDTALILDGILEKRKKGFARNHPIADFVDTLPKLASRGISPAIKEHIKIMTKELPYVRFDQPEGFENEITFMPLGIEGYKKGPNYSRARRILIMSPFLSEGYINCLSDNGSKNVLISRAESLDAISDKIFNKIAKNTQCYVLNTEAEKPADELPESDESILSGDESGLHAKIYLVDEGWYTRVISGSANATNAAFNGNNVEFLVDICGRRSVVGIDSFLDEKSEKTSFRSLIRKYQRSNSVCPEDKLKAKLNALLEETREQIINASLQGKATPNGDGTFNLEVTSKRKLSFNPMISNALFYPISLKAENGASLSTLFKDGKAVFINMSLVGLSTFFAFKLTAIEGNVKVPSIGFVLNIPVDGIPQERNSLILRAVISDKNRFIQYLLFLLSDDPAGFQLTDILTSGTEKKSAANGVTIPGLPLLEELVRAYSRHPDKIRHVKKLIDELNKSEETKALLPEGFDDMWSIFLEAIENDDRILK